MFRTVRNIFTLLIIGIIASGIPIYANSINITALLPNIISSKNVITVTTEQNIISPNHVQVKLGFSPKSNANYSNFFFDESNPFTIELSSNNNMVQGLSLDELVSSGNYKAMEFYDSDTVKYVTFEFEQNKLNLPDGSYDLKIIPNIKGKNIDITESEFVINFNTEGSYVQANPYIKTGETALTLYFPDNEFNYLIPITKIVKSNAYPLTTTIRNIEKAPNKNLGLPTISPIPIGCTAGKAGNVAHVRLPKNISEFDQGSTKATTAINSLIRSLTSLDGISKVQFYLTGKYSNDPFHGIDLSKPFDKLDEIEIYTAYISDTGRLLLSPLPFSRFSDYFADINIEAIFNSMKFIAMPEIYNAKRHPLVPNDIELLEYSIDKGMVTLIFDEGFTEAYKDNSNRHKMMVDGIIYTFMSIKGVNSVNIKIRPSSADSNGSQLINYDLTVPTHINLEGY